MSGDGAEWIGNLSGRPFPGAAEDLDVFPGAEPVAEAARRLFGEGTAEAWAEAERGRRRLLEDGPWGVAEWLGELGGRLPAGGEGASLGETLNYFAGHQGRLNYALRLRRGQSIGSGRIEGTIKQLLNRRLKQTGARWKGEHVGPFVRAMRPGGRPGVELPLEQRTDKIQRAAPRATRIDAAPGIGYRPQRGRRVGLYIRRGMR